MPLVTIVVPVRNGASTLRSALASVAAQTYPRLEIILSDNASEDETGTIMREFCAQRSDTTYVRHEQPLRVLDHFSKMIAAARGRYTLLCAADDHRNETFVEALVQSLELDPNAVLAFGRLMVFDSEKVTREIEFSFENDGAPRWLRVFKSARLQCFHFYGLWRTSVIQGINLRECTYWPDMQVMMGANVRGTFVRNQRAVFNYFETPKSNKERAKVQSFGQNEKHFRLHMIRTAMDAIVDAHGGLPLAAFAGAILGLRELRTIAAEVRIHYRSRGRTESRYETSR